MSYSAFVIFFFLFAAADFSGILDCFFIFGFCAVIVIVFLLFRINDFFVLFCFFLASFVGRLLDYDITTLLPGVLFSLFFLFGVLS